MGALSETPGDRLGHLLSQLAEELRPLVAEWVQSAGHAPGLPAPEPAADRWLSPSEAAARVGVHRRTVYRALAAGALQGGQLEAGSGACRWRIRSSEVDRWAGARTERFQTAEPPGPSERPRRPLQSSSQSYRARIKEQQ